MSSERAKGRGRPKREFTRPAVVNDAVSRGEMAKYLLRQIGISVTDFAQVTGIGRSTLQGYLAGRQDIAAMKRANAHAFLTGLGISDSQGWELFAIPEEVRDEWRSNRPPPLGHGTVDTREPDEFVVLDGPLFGEMSLPASVTVFYDPGGQGRFYLMQLSDGTMFATSRPEAPAGATVLGAMTTCSFGPPPTIPGLHRGSLRS